MTRDYIRVTPTSEGLTANEIPTVLASLHKLTAEDSGGLLGTLNPFGSSGPPRFEFLALSEGHDEPVEFYYGAAEHLDTLETRLRSIYPTTFDVECVTIDLPTKLVPPVEFSQEEFIDAVKAGDLLYEWSEDAGETDGDAEVDVEEGRDGDKTQTPTTDDDDGRETDEKAPDTRPSLSDGGTAVDPNAGTQIDVGDDSVDVAPPEALPDDSPQTAVDQPTLTDQGTILARPAIDELRPQGVRWYGSAIRKKDWMTTIVPFTEASDSLNESASMPLATLIDQLSEAEFPVAFQVVFQRRASWQADADLRKEDLADGRDTLGQRLIGPFFEFNEYSSETKKRELPEVVKQRIDRVTAKNPKRTFTVNLWAVAVPPIDDRDAFDDLDSQLNPL